MISRQDSERQTEREIWSNGLYWIYFYLVSYCPLLLMHRMAPAVTHQLYVYVCMWDPLSHIYQRVAFTQTKQLHCIKTTCLTLIWVHSLTVQTRLGWVYWLSKGKILAELNSKDEVITEEKCVTPKQNWLDFILSLYFFPFYLSNYVMFCHEFVSAQQPGCYISLLNCVCCCWD